MRLQATLDLVLPGEAIQRSPSLWERVRGAFGGKLDLSTDRARVAMEATAIVTQVRAALRRLGIDNAVSLVIDDTVLFNDTEGRPDDLGDLMLALSEHAALFGQGFRSLRFAVEHTEAGLHALIETQCLGEHKKGQPAAKVRVSGRIVDLEPRPGEGAEAYRARVTPIATDPGLVEAHRRQFEAFVAKLANALRAAFPEGTLTEHDPETKVVRPQANGAVPSPSSPFHPAYDPYAYYYPHPFEGMLSGMLIGSFLSHAMWSPGIMVVHPSGALIGGADGLDSHLGELQPDAPDPGDVNEAGGGDGAFGDGDFGVDEAEGGGEADVDDAGDFGDDGGDFGDDAGDFGGDGGDFGGDY